MIFCSDRAFFHFASKGSQPVSRKPTLLVTRLKFTLDYERFTAYTDRVSDFIVDETVGQISWYHR